MQTLYGGQQKRSTRDIGYIIYYSVLLLITFILSKPHAAYGELVRYVYLGAVVLPLFFNKSYVVFALTLFFGISQTSFVSLMPTASYYMLCIVVVLCFMQVKIKRDIVPVFIWILYVLCVELLNMTPHLECVICGIATLLLSCYVGTKQDLSKIGVAFCLISLVLGLLFVIFFNEFAEQFFMKGNEEVERSGWINANIFGGVIGCGMVSSVLMLVNPQDFTLSKLVKSLCLCCVILSTIVLILNASRGALIASILASLILLFCSRIKRTTLVLILLGCVLLLTILYSAGYFELLELRVAGENNNTETAGGRTEIWAEKFEAFGALPAYTQLIGVGYYRCVDLGIYFDTHNDFVTALCAYGFIGLLSFVIFSIAPIFIASRRYKLTVLGLVVFLAIEGFVLSPIFRGYFVFFVFYLMIIKFAAMTRRQQSLGSR